MKRQAVLVLGLTLAMFLVSTLMIARLAPVPGRLDEDAHYSYVEDMRLAPRLFVEHGSLRLLDRPTVSQWMAERGNYLSHPPLYYLTFAALASTDRGIEALKMLRLYNAVFIALAMGALAWFVLPHLTRMAGVMVFCGLLTFTPKLVLVSGFLSNDGLAALTGLAALVGWLQGWPWLIALALAVAGWTKATALLAVGLVIVLVHGFSARRILEDGTRQIKPLAIIGLGGVLGGLPYLWSVWTHGKPFYVDVAYHALGGVADRLLNPSEFAAHFFSTLVNKWSAFDLGWQLDQLMLPILIGLAVVVALRSTQHRGLALAILITTLMILLQHWYFAHDMHLKTLDISVSQFRYYLPLLPLWAFAAARGAEDVTHPMIRSVLLVVIMGLLLYGWVPMAMLRMQFL